MMMGIFSAAGRGMGALGLGLAAGGIAWAQVDRPQVDRPMLALVQLEPGLWELREAGNDRARPSSLCIGDPAILLQLEHRQIACSRVVITNEPKALSVHYVCPYNGFGQTSLRVRTARSARIDTQGIVNNAPFAYRVEARRLGPCGPQRRARR